MRLANRLAPLALSITVAASSVAIATTPVYAETVADGPSVTSEAKASTADQKYSDRDVVAFFVLGTGRIYDDKPELAKSLGITRQDVSDADIEYVLQKFNEVDPEFNSAVTNALQSGDAERAQSGLDRLVDDSSKVADRIQAESNSGTERTPGSALAAKGKGKIYQTNYVVTTNVAVGGAAAVVLVAAAAVCVVVVLYSPDASATSYEKDLLASKVSRGLA